MFSNSQLKNCAINHTMRNVYFMRQLLRLVLICFVGVPLSPAFAMHHAESHTATQANARAANVKIGAVSPRQKPHAVLARHRRIFSPKASSRALAPEPRDTRNDLPDGLSLLSNAAYIYDETNQKVLADRNPDQVQPIASITKLMTAVVVLQQGLPLDELIEIDEADVDKLRHTHSLLKVGTRYTRRDLLLMALMASENRAAAALGRSVPEGREAFIDRMNAVAAQLGMNHTHFEDTSGLNGHNQSSARDLALLVHFSAGYPVIQEFTTTPQAVIAPAVGGRPYVFRNTNMIVRQGQWDVVVSKTGFINESGQCLVMQARIDGRLTTMVLLDSHGRFSRINDAQRVRKWLEYRAVQEAKLGQREVSPKLNAQARS